MLRLHTLDTSTGRIPNSNRTIKIQGLRNSEGGSVSELADLGLALKPAPDFLCYLYIWSSPTCPMTTEEANEAEKRADTLAVRALELWSAGEAQEAHRALQEAIHLAPDNARVRTTFTKLRQDDSEHILLKLCSKFVFANDESAGKEAVSYLQASQDLPTNVARECTKLVLRRNRGPRYPLLQDGILAGLLRESATAKATLAERLQENHTTGPFEDVYTIGDGAANGIATVVLTPSAWETEAARDACEKDVFQLYMAKLMEAGDDDNSRALRGISKLLATDAPKLQSLVDEDTFDAILSCLDYRNPIETKSPATLAIAKFLEAAENRGQVMLTEFVTTHYAKQTTEDLVLAFSAAAAVFPIATSIAATMFLKKDFLPSLVPLLEKKAKSKHVEMAALEMLNAACVDSACREGIRKHCMSWLKDISDSNQGKKSASAAVTLVKAQSAPSQDNPTSNGPQQGDGNEDLINKLTQLMFEDSKANKTFSFEGLAHASIQPKVKEKLANDKGWLRVFLQELGQAEAHSPAIYGGLVIIDNLTAYLPVLSEEQKRMAQLRAYSNASPSSKRQDPLEEDEAVMTRCKVIIEGGVVATIVSISNHLSPTCLALVSKIMLSLTRSTKALKGIITQQGGVRLLATYWDRVEGTPTQRTESRRNAAQALARLLISSDPSVLFGPSGNALLQSAVTSLASLLTDNAAMALEAPHDLLPTFEALMALTNLASIPSNGAPAMIMKLCYADIEDLVLSSNTRVQRAATELVCNLVQDPAGTSIFAELTPDAERRLHILLALAGSGDLGTRKAAGGALASLTEGELIVRAINRQERGAELVLAMLDDENEEMLHRGMVCLANIIGVITYKGYDAGVEAILRLRQLGVEEKMKDVITKTRSAEIQQLVVQASRSLNNNVP
ncbi:MAG: hypothetical protein Q9217_003460 [Psora testacea]